MTTCTHIDQIEPVTPAANGCVGCLAVGDRWVHLRVCMTCGYVGCCDSSKNKHASHHALTTDHPIVQSFEPREHWLWCFVDETVVDADVPNLSYTTS
jgi:uncharacterized UBP type Zn finger protein